MIRVYFCTFMCFTTVYALSSLLLFAIFYGNWNVGLQINGNGMLSLCVAGVASLGFLGGCLYMRHQNGGK
ncbi:MAG: hypothetical protein K2X27_25750 [Candidatus Obscuribacterales bacterium]|nr:hypothetical protein [Candidatus Obscuribacterales bacterium]